MSPQYLNGVESLSKHITTFAFAVFSLCKWTWGQTFHLQDWEACFSCGAKRKNNSLNSNIHYHEDLLVALTFIPQKFLLPTTTKLNIVRKSFHFKMTKRNWVLFLLVAAFYWHHHKIPFLLVVTTLIYFSDPAK